MFRKLGLLLILTLVFFKSTSVYAYTNFVDRDNRFWDNQRFLFEKSYTPEKNLHNQDTGNLDCLNDAVKTVPQTMDYYDYYYNKDIQILTNLDNMNPKVGVVLFSRRLTNQAQLLAGLSYTAPLFLQSLIKKMCPEIKTTLNYNEEKAYQHYDMLIFELE